MFKNVLVGVDGCLGGRDAIALASQLLEPQGAITLAHVYEEFPLSTHGLVQMLVGDDPRAEAEELLKKERSAAGMDAELVAVRAASAGRGLHEEAQRRDADLLVLGTCRHGTFGRALLGNDTRDAINGAPCAIAVASLGYAQTRTPIRTIGVGYNDSPESRAALEAAKVLAKRLHAQVRAREIVYIPYAGGLLAASGPGIDELIEDSNKRMRELPNVRGDAVYGLPTAELASFGEGSDLLIVGSRGYGPWRRVVLGSTSMQLQSLGGGPLLILPRGTRHSGKDSTEGESERTDALAGV